MLTRRADCSRGPSQKREIAKPSLAGSMEGARWTNYLDTAEIGKRWWPSAELFLARTNVAA